MQKLDSGWTVGTSLPENVAYLDLSDNPTIQAYLEGAGWENGVGLLLLGEPGCGKTSAGLTVLRSIYRATRQTVVYWHEHDFLADIRNLWRLEDMTKSLPRDDALWMDYVEWERAVWMMKDSPVMFLDTVGRSYTAMQKYEVENLLRYRLDRSLATISAVDGVVFQGMSKAMKSVLTRSGLTVMIG